MSHSYRGQLWRQVGGGGGAGKKCMYHFRQKIPMLCIPYVPEYQCGPLLKSVWRLAVHMYFLPSLDLYDTFILYNQVTAKYWTFNFRRISFFLCFFLSSVKIGSKLVGSIKHMNMIVYADRTMQVKPSLLSSNSVHTPSQTSCDGDHDCRANPKLIIITISALANICLQMSTVYGIFVYLI